jgi:hypothetical protein
LLCCPQFYDQDTIEDISDYLYEKGVAGNSIKTLVDLIDDLHMIAKWYKRTPAPSEFETEAYLIIPLLRALGWTPQKIAASGIGWTLHCLTNCREKMLTLLQW